MDEKKFLVEQFESNRARLRAVAYRMLGSTSEVDDAVQETWLRLSRSDTSAVEHLGGGRTTVVARVCLDMLRSRKSRREEPMGPHVPEPVADDAHGRDAEMADSVGAALLVVLETLAPAERLAFVLHDMFAVPFDEIATIVGRSPAAARQLASRARRRVQGTDVADAPADRARQRAVVDAFLAASRSGDFDALLALLDPDVVLRADEAAGRPGGRGPRRGGGGRDVRRAGPGGATGPHRRRGGADVGAGRAAEGRLRPHDRRRADRRHRPDPRPRPRRRPRRGAARR